MKLKSIILFLIISSHSVSAGDEWSYEYPYTDNFLYLHSLVNYSYNISWKYEFQKNLLSKNNMALNFASITTADLQTDSYLNLNQQLGTGWRFKGVGKYRANRFENEQIKYFGLGFEKTIVNNIGVFFLLNPTYEKENSDISFGAQITSDNRENYLLAEVELEDFLFNEKDDYGGKYLKDPVAFKWQLRYGHDRFFIFSSGRISTGFERIHENVELSPDLRFHSRQLNSAHVNLTYLIEKEFIAALSYDLYSFHESKSYSLPEENFIYDNSINRISIECRYTFQEVNNFRILSHYIMQDAFSIGYRAHDYSRNELANGLFYQRIFSAHALEAGLLFSIFNWDYMSYFGRDNYNRKDNVVKLMLSYQYQFENDAVLLFSLSQEIDTNAFGGGNLQYMMFF